MRSKRKDPRIGPTGSVPLSVARRRRIGQLMSSSAIALAFAVPALANPTGGQIVGGNAQISQPNSKTLVVNQSTQNAVIDWQSFSIGSGEKTVFRDPNASAVTLNRVIGADPSTIAGQLSSNGQLILVNPSGIVFANGSQVDVNGLVATTANIRNGDFMAGNLAFDQAPAKSNASVVNHGTLTIGQAGLAALVAPSVANSGVINAKLGRVVLGGAETFTVDLYGDGLVKFDASSAVKEVPVTTDGKPATALVSNTGQISADGGHILLTADAAYGLVSNVVDAGGSIDARAENGRTGVVEVTAVGAGAVVSGAIDVSGLADGAVGGIATVTGKTVTLTRQASIDARGFAGGGKVEIGGGPHGADQGLANAGATTIAAGARIDASAVDRGNGGMVSVWSNGATQFAGSIFASGGASGGNGGWVETSGESLSFGGGRVDTSAAKGRFGTWLLDPTNLKIDGTNVGTLETELVKTDIVLSATGDIDVSANIVAPSNSGSLGLVAGADISLGANIDFLGAAKQTISLVAGGSIIEAGGVIELGSGDNLSLSAVTGIGTAAKPILTDGLDGFAAANDTSGGIFISNSTAGTAAIDSVAGFTGTKSALSNGNTTTIATLAGIDEIAAGDIVIDDPLGGLSLTAGSLAGTDDVTLQAQALTTAGGQSITTGGSITFQADTMTLGGTVRQTGTGDVLIEPLTANRPISLGGGAAGLSLSVAELNGITTGSLQIGTAADSGVLTVAGALSNATNGALQHVGDLTLQTGAGGITIDAGVTLGANDLLTLASTGGVAATNGALAGGAGGLDLLLQGSGTFTLDNAKNSIGTLAGTVGSLALVDNAALTVGTLGGVSGLTATGSVALKSVNASADDITVGQRIALEPGGLLTLNTAGLVDASAAGLAIQGTGAGLSLVLKGGGTFDLTNAGNSISAVAGQVGSVTLVDPLALDITTLSGIAGLTATGNIALSETGTASGANQITLDQALASSGAGATIALRADELTFNAALQATGAGGTVSLKPFSQNIAIDVGGTGVLGLNVTSADLKLITATNLQIGGGADTGALTVADTLADGTGGTLQNVTNLTLEGGTGTIFVTNPISLPSGQVTLQADGLIMVQPVTASTLTIEPFTPSVAVDIGGSLTSGLELSLTELFFALGKTLVIGDTAGTAPLTVSGSFTALNNLDLVSGSGGISINASLDAPGILTLSSGGGISINDSITGLGGLSLSSGGAIIQTAGTIFGPDLAAQASTGGITLTDVSAGTVRLTTASGFDASLTDEVDTSLVADVGGKLTASLGDSALTLSGNASWATLDAASVTFGAFTVTTDLQATASTGEIKVSDSVSAGKTLSFTADSMEFDASLTAPSVLLVPETASRTISLGGTTDPGADLFLSNASIGQIASPDLVIGSSSDTATLRVVGSFTVPSDLTLLSGTAGIQLAGSFTIGDTLTLGSGGAIEQSSGTITVPTLDASAADAIDLTTGITASGISTVSLTTTESEASLVDLASETVLTAAIGQSLDATISGQLQLGGTAGSADLGAASISFETFKATTTIMAKATGASGIMLEGDLSGGNSISLASAGSVTQRSGQISAPILYLMANGGGIALDGNVTADSSISLIASDGITQGAGQITTSMLGATANGVDGITLDGLVSVSNSISLISTGGVTEGTSGRISTPVLDVTAKGGGIDLGNVTASGTDLTLSLTASGDAKLGDNVATVLTSSVDGALTATVGGGLTLNGKAGSAILQATMLSVGPFDVDTTLSATATSTGGIIILGDLGAGTSETLISAGGISQTGGLISTPSLSATANGGSIQLVDVTAPSVSAVTLTTASDASLTDTAPTQLTSSVGGMLSATIGNSLAVAGTAGSAVLQAGSIDFGLFGVMTTLQADTTAGGAVDFDGNVMAGTSIALQSAGAVIQNSGMIEAPALTVEADGGVIQLIDVTASGPSAVTLTTNFDAALTDKATSTTLVSNVGGQLTATIAGSLGISGSAGSAVLGGGAISFGKFNLGTTLGATSGGSGGITIGDDMTSGGTVTLTSSGGIVQTGGTISAPNVVAAANGGDIDLISVSAPLVSLTTGTNATLTDIVPATVTTAVGGALDVTVTGTLDIVGTAGAADLNATGIDFGNFAASQTLMATAGTDGIEITGTVSSLETATLESGGGITQTTGSIAAPELVANATGGDIVLDNANAVLLSLTTPFNASVTDTVSSGITAQIGQSLAVTDTGSLVITGTAGSAKLAAVNITLDDFGAGTSLDAQARNVVEVDGKVSAGEAIDLISTGAGGVVRVVKAGVVKSTAGDIALGSFGANGNVAVGGTVRAVDGEVYVNAAGGIVDAGSISGNDDLLDAGGSLFVSQGAVLTASRNIWIGYGLSDAAPAFRGFSVATTLGGAVDIAGGVSATRGEFGVIAGGGVSDSGTVAAIDDSIASGGAIGISGSMTASHGAAILTASGDIVDSGTVLAASVQAAAGGAIDISGSMRASAGDISLTAQEEISDSGAVSGNSLQVSSSGAVDISGSMTASSGAVAVAASGGVTDGGSVSGETVQVTSGGAIDIPGSMTASNGGVVLAASDGVTDGGSVSGESVQVTSGGTLDVGGSMAGSNGVQVSSEGAVAISGSIIGMNGLVSLNAANGITDSGTVSGLVERVTAGGPIDITGSMIASGGDVSLAAIGGIADSGVISGVDDLIDAGGAVTVGGGGSLSATRDIWIGYGAGITGPILTGGVVPQIVGGSIDVAGSVIAGRYAGLQAAGTVTIEGTLQGAAWTFVTASGGIADTGLVSGGGVSLAARGNIDERGSGSIVAATLEGSSGGFTRLDGPANHIGTLGEFSTSGAEPTSGAGFQLLDQEALELGPDATIASVSPLVGALPTVAFSADSSGIVTASLGNVFIDVAGPQLTMTLDNRAEIVATGGQVLLAAPDFLQKGASNFDTRLAVVDVAGDAFVGPDAVKLPVFKPTGDLGTYVTQTSSLLTKGRDAKGTIKVADLTASGALLMIGYDAKMSGKLDVGSLAVIAQGGTADFNGMIHGYGGLTAASNEEFARQCSKSGTGCLDLSNDLKFNNCAIGSPSCIPLPAVVIARPIQVDESDIVPQSSKTDDIDVEPVNTGREDAY
jgi:filamentous hemagglutinin family protein